MRKILLVLLLFSLIISSLYAGGNRWTSVVRTAYVIGKTIKSNHNYQLEAITMPHPTDQRATHLVYGIAENKTNIDEFKVNPKIIEELRIFKV